jgi:Flp pilus assembly protein TadD
MSAEEKSSPPPASQAEPAPEKRPSRREIAMLAGVALAGAAMAFGASFINASATARVISPLDVPVDVMIDDTRIPLGPGGLAQVRLRDGVHPVRVLGAAGEVIEEQVLDVPGGYDVVVYNVLGGAPLYSVKVHYGSSEQTTPKSDPVFAGGLHTFAQERVDFLFAEPPSTITVENGDSRVRTRFDVAPGGYITTVSFLESKGDLDRAAEVARAVVRAEPGDARALAYARDLTESAEGPEGLLRYFREEIARRPTDGALHLAYARALRRSGRGDEARSIYRERLAAAPGDVAVSLALAVVSSQPEARAIYGSLVAAHAGDPLVQEEAGRFAFVTGDFAGAVRLFAALAGTPRHRYVADDQAMALVALGRPSEAAPLIAELADADATLDLPTALLYAEIALLPGVRGALAPRAYIDRLAAKRPKASLDLWAKSLLGDAVSADAVARIEGSDLRATVDIQRTAARDPRDAWDRCSTESRVALQQLHAPVAMLLAAEYGRAGDRATALRIFDAHRELGVPPEALLAYVIDGTEPPDLWHVGPELRAGLDLARARRLDELGQPSDAMYAQVEREDLLQGFVTRARASWPSLKPKPAADGKKPGPAGKSPKPAPPKPDRTIVYRRRG